MRDRSARSPLFACLAVLAAFLVAQPLADLSGAAIPLAVATLLVAVLLLVVATAVLGQPSGRALAAWQVAASGTRAPARQCDPDAAGHVRARAPGRPRALFVR